jgi:hypothetical protein
MPTKSSELFHKLKAVQDHIHVCGALADSPFRSGLVRSSYITSSNHETMLLPRLCFTGRSPHHSEHVFQVPRLHQCARSRPAPRRLVAATARPIHLVRLCALPNVAADFAAIRSAVLAARRLVSVGQHVWPNQSGRAALVVLVLVLTSPIHRRHVPHVAATLGRFPLHTIHAVLYARHHLGAETGIPLIPLPRVCF